MYHLQRNNMKEVKLRTIVTFVISVPQCRRSPNHFVLLLQPPKRSSRENIKYQFEDKVSDAIEPLE